MAMSAAAGIAGTNLKTWNVSATADADTGDVTIPHGLGVAPGVTFLTPLLPAANLASWTVKTVDATNVVLNKGTTTAGSGNASAQIRLTAMTPHSLIG